MSDATADTQPSPAPSAPPSDHHYDEHGVLVRSETQKKLIADLEESSRISRSIDRTPKGGEDGRTLVRFCRVPAPFTAYAEELHRRRFEAEAAQIEAAAAKQADTEPPPTPRAEDIAPEDRPTEEAPHASA